MEIPKISDAEWRVMRVLWETSPLSADEVVDALAATTHWKPKTVKTLLNRLANKGALRFEKDGRRYLYHPCVEEAACVRAETRSFVDRVYDGALTPMLASFLQQERLTEEEIAALKRILDEKGRG